MKAAIVGNLFFGLIISFFALPFTGLMLIAGSLPDAHFSLALIYIVSTGDLGQLVPRLPR